jgi:uncharacterized membrane protein HdeD (DUF308 family)
MERDKKLEKLFKEINEKPKNLDHNIMSAIYRQVELNKAAEHQTEKSWNWTMFVVGVLCVLAAIYAFTFINFQKDILVWIIGLSALIPLIIDKILFSNRNIKLR